MVFVNLFINLCPLTHPAAHWDYPTRPTGCAKEKTPKRDTQEGTTKHSTDPRRNVERPQLTRGGNPQIPIADLTKRIASSDKERPESSRLESGLIVKVPSLRFPLYPPGSWLIVHWNLTDVLWPTSVRRWLRVIHTLISHS